MFEKYFLSLFSKALPKLPPNLPKSYDIIIGNPVIIPCPAEGTPEPTIAWLKNGVRVTELIREGISILDDGSLNFAKVTVNNNGAYKCIATNVAGNITYQTKLTVLGKKIYSYLSIT